MNARGWGLALVAFGVAGACKSKAGDACDPGAETCKDGHTRLVCLDGKFVETPCRGERGCFVTEKKTNCDITGNFDGDACTPKERGRVACTDGNHYVACIDGKYVAYACGNGCLDNQCDQSVAEASSKCLAEGGFACTADRLHQLECIDGRMVKVADCRGPKQCDVRKEVVECDSSRAEAGDTCKGSMDQYACSSNGKQLLRCVLGKYALYEACSGPKGCSVQGYRSECDTSIAAAGDSCDADFEYAACSADMKTLLACKDDQWQVDPSCKAGCTLGGEPASPTCAK